LELDTESSSNELGELVWGVDVEVDLPGFLRTKKGKKT
jgi:hypothetical protein